MFINLYQQLHYSTEKTLVALAQLRVTCPPKHKGLGQSYSLFQNNTIQRLAYNKANLEKKNYITCIYYCKSHLSWSLMGLISCHGGTGNLPLLEVFPFSLFISYNYEEASADQSYKDYDGDYSSPSTTFNILILFPAGQSEYLLEGGKRFLGIWWAYFETNLNPHQPRFYIQF